MNITQKMLIICLFASSMSLQAASSSSKSKAGIPRHKRTCLAILLSALSFTSPTSALAPLTTTTIEFIAPPHSAPSTIPCTFVSYRLPSSPHEYRLPRPILNLPFEDKSRNEAFVAGVLQTLSSESSSNPPTVTLTDAHCPLDCMRISPSLVECETYAFDSTRDLRSHHIR